LIWFFKKRKLCEDSDSRLGLYAEAWSGDNRSGLKNVECNISKSSRVRYCIKVINLKTYALNVNVEGKIKSTFNKVEFAPQGANDTPKYWEDNYPGLRDGDEKVFDHIKIVNKGTQIGSEKIEATVTANWPEPEEDDSIPLVFDVMT
jgi:hypothetical protein